ncbi:MAG: ComF family protein [bacterium]|nr:ComF family protein [bacterium]
MKRLLRWLWASLFDLLYPRDCILCGQPVDRPIGHLCTACRFNAWPETHATCTICAIESHSALQPAFICTDCARHRPAFEKAFVALRYYGEMKELIQTFKYRRGLWLIHDLVHYLEVTYYDKILGQGIHIDALVPIPSTRAKLRQRGYNQSERLAHFLAKRLQLPCYKNLLQRNTTPLKAQVRLQRNQRFANAKRAYTLRRPLNLKGKTLLLIDDVMTTGATLNACATHLKAQGATIYTLVLARPLFG